MYTRVTDDGWYGAVHIRRLSTVRMECDKEYFFTFRVAPIVYSSRSRIQQATVIDTSADTALHRSHPEIS